MELKLKSSNIIKTELKINPGGEAHKFFTSTCAKHMDKYVPYDEGNLSDYYIEGVDEIVYEQEYAGYQYYGERKDGTHKIDPANRNRSYHPLATSYWDTHMITAEKDDVNKEVADYIKKYGGK